MNRDNQSIKRRTMGARILVLCLMLCLLVGCGKNSNKNRFMTACDLLNNKQYEAAYEIFKDLGDYKGSDRFAKECLRHMNQNDTSQSGNEPTQQSAIQEPGVPEVQDSCMDAVQITDDVFAQYATEDWQKAYKKILDATYSGNSYVKPDVTDAQYFLYDIDKDGVPELLLKSVQDEASYMTEVFCWDGREAHSAGEAYSGRTLYYSDPDHNGVIAYSMHMGSGAAFRFSLENGKLIEPEDWIFEDDMMSRYEVDLEPEPIPVADMVAGAEVLKSYCPKYTYSLLAYQAPVYAAGREQLTDEDFSIVVEDVVNGKMDFYWVPAETYTPEECTFRDQKVKWDALLQEDALYDHVADRDIQVKSMHYEDFNGDGLTECLVELRDRKTDALALVLLSYQHGQIYGYTAHYLGDWGIETENGRIYASGIYDGSMEIVFTYCLDQARMHLYDGDRVILSDGAKADLNDIFRKKLQSEKAKLGVAYIGCSGNYSQVYLGELFSDTKKEYPDLRFMGELGKCHVVKQPGEDVYVLVPANERDVIRVYSLDWGDYNPDVYPKRGELLYQGKAGEIVVVRCNQSDLVSNVEIVLDMQGSELVYSPQMSLENGKLLVDTGVYDFGKDNLLSD